MMQSGGAIVAASDIVIDQGKQVAAHISGSRRRRCGIRAWAFWNAAGTDLGIHIMDLAERLRTVLVTCPRTCRRHWMSGTSSWGVPSAFPNGCHIAGEGQEVDPKTGVVEIVSYATVNDTGVLVNPMLVAGLQAHGGIAQAHWARP